MITTPLKGIHAATLCAALACTLTACRRESSPSGDARPVAQSPTDHGEFNVTARIVAGTNDAFVDITGDSGIQFVHQFCDTRIANIVESNGAGVAVLDYDNDGLMDVYLVNSGPLAGVTHHPGGTVREPNRLFRNLGKGKFEDVTAKAGVAGSGYGMAAVAADYDNDGWTDLYVVNVGKNILFRNRGNGTFEDVTAKAGVGDAGTGIGAVFFDADADGKLDLFVANYLTFDPNYNLYFNPDGYPGPLAYQPEMNVLYRNKGDGTFENVSEASGIELKGHRGMSVSAFDANGDGATDLYLCNDATPNVLLINNGKGHFEDAALKMGVAFNALGEAAGSMTAAVADANGDLLPDILVSRLGYGSMYCAKTNHLFDDRMMASGLGQLTAEFVGWGCNFIDFDNDGDRDIFVANGDAHHMVGWEPLLLENDGRGNFTNARQRGGAFFETKLRGRSSVVADFDNDGQLDLLVTAIADRPFLMQNRTPTTNSWLTLALEGTHRNRDGIGAQVTVTAGGRKQAAEVRCDSAFLGMGDKRLHFGLGTAKAIEQIDIVWPGGAKQVLKDVKPNQILKIKEP